MLLDVTMKKDSAYGGVHHARTPFICTIAAVSTSFAARSYHTGRSTATTKPSTASQGSSTDAKIYKQPQGGVQPTFDPTFTAATSASDP
jgi:hypothetical protein